MSGRHALKDMTGQRFGRLTVLHLAKDYPKREGAYWICKCDCGNQVRVKGYFLRSGKTRSCTCYQKEVAGALNRGKFGECARNQCFNNYRHLARMREIAFELTKEEFFKLTQGCCYYCGAAPSQVVKVPSRNGSFIYNGIDRLDSSKSYTVDNCVPACGVHNLMKLEMSVDEFIASCRAVVNYYDAKKIRLVQQERFLIDTLSVS